MYRVGRFSNAPRSARRLYSPVLGYRFDRIEITCTMQDFVDPRFHEWIRECLLCRLVSPGSLSIEVT